MIYAIGDIHGQYTMLCELLEQLSRIPLGPYDRIVFLGDYIDRGENSCAVISKLLEIREQRPSTVFLRGNHEQLMLDARAGEPPIEGADPGSVLLDSPTLHWFENGGVATLFSYRPEIDTADLLHWWDLIPDEHWKFLESTGLEFMTEQYHFVHAGLVPPGKEWEYADIGLDPRLWIREPFISSRADFGRVVVFGHTPQRRGRPLIKRNKLGLDTGAVFGGSLTAAGLDETDRVRPNQRYTFYQVESPQPMLVE